MVVDNFECLHKNRFENHSGGIGDFTTAGLDIVFSKEMMSWQIVWRINGRRYHVWSHIPSHEEACEILQYCLDMEVLFV